MMPRRVQRKRTKGWRMPENTVYVGRPTKWGNPWTVWLDDEGYGPDRWRPAWRVSSGGNHIEPPFGHKIDALTEAVRQFREGIVTPGPHHSRFIDPVPTVDDVFKYLGGKSLACWCPLDKPCHADVLLELANPKPAP